MMLQNMSVQNGLQNLKALKTDLINLYAKDEGACPGYLLQQLYGECDTGYLMNMSTQNPHVLQSLYA